jgi:hypothetical protein
MAWGKAEEHVRKEIHNTLKGEHAQLAEQLRAAGTGVLPEAGKAQKEDEFGFPESKGGYKKFREDRGDEVEFNIDPMDMLAGKVIDQELLDELNANSDECRAIVDSYQINATDLQTRWLEDGGQATFDAAKGRPELLAQIEVPTFAFQKAGIDAALDELLPHLRRVIHIPKLPPFELAVDVDFDVIADIESFKKEFAADLAKAVGLGDAGTRLPGRWNDVSRIGIRDMRAGKVEIEFLPGLSPSVNELMANTMSMFKKEASKLPGVLKKLLPEIPEIPEIPELSALGLRVKALLESEPPRSVAMRRKLDRLLQAFVLAVVQESGLYHRLEQKVDDLPLPPIGGFDKQLVLSLVFDMAEGQIRRQVHAQMMHAHAELMARAPAGAYGAYGVQGATQHHGEGEAQEGDEYGFVVSEGGYEAFKVVNSFSAMIGSIVPADQVRRVISPALADKLKQDAAARVRGLVDAYFQKSEEAKGNWLEWEGQERLTAAKKNKKKLALIEVPSCNFHKAGLGLAIQQLESQLLYEDDGAEAMGPVAERVRVC